MKSMFMLSMVSILLMVGATSAVAEDFEELITQVGEDYGKAYSSPFLYGFGPNQNANLFSTASIPWGKLVFGIGIKGMATHLNAEDQNFQKVINDVDLGDYDPNFAGQVGDVVMGGPTVFGSTSESGVIRGYIGGIEVFEQETIPGLLDTRYVPLFTPEGYIGGIFGLKGVIRWLPEMDAGDLGKTEYMGLGLQWSLSGLLKTFPIDIMLGYFDQKLKVGTILDSRGKSLHLAVSKSLPALTFYGGYAMEESSMDIRYTYEATGQEIKFETEGRQEHRFTIGLTLDILAKLNVEMAHGDLTTYSAGLMFGI